MPNEDEHKFPSPAARQRFGHTLLRWRQRAGWAHDTMDRWGAAAGFMRVKNSVYSKLERGLVISPKPLTFIQLSVANDRLARQEYGAITDRRLKDLVEAQEPIITPDGRPWNEADFFGHFCGVIPPPPWAEAGALVSPEQAQKLSQQQQEIFSQYAQEMMLPPAQAFDQLATHCKGMNAEQIQTFRKVLGGWYVWTPEEIQALTDALGHNAAVQALLSWCDQEGLLEKFRNMRPD